MGAFARRTYFDDLNQDGVQQRTERGLGGILIQLLSKEGDLVATTRTAADGRYEFEHLDLGEYQVRTVVPVRTVATKSSASVSITRGMEIHNIDLGLFHLVPRRGDVLPIASLPLPRSGQRG